MHRVRCFSAATKKTNFYEILNVSRNFDSKELKTQFYKLSKIHHPDMGGDNSKFIEIREAFETLNDAAKRQEYDLSLGGRNDHYNTISHESRMHRSQINPDDFILHRRSSNMSSPFNFAEHQRAHYGNAKNYYKYEQYNNLYQDKKFKWYKVFLVMGFGVMIYYSDLIQVNLV
jgi:DnaJ-class molecular chaperone